MRAIFGCERVPWLNHKDLELVFELVSLRAQGLQIVNSAFFETTWLTSSQTITFTPKQPIDQPLWSFAPSN
tara:strand:+ start:375 stop:587 length:213 start_codon:yes stop_codon:yes gene_type:complete